MWPEDPKLCQATLALYDAVWPHLPPGIERARAWGGDWFAVSTPFLARSGVDVLAHTGVIECDWSVGGERRRVAALHGVCVHPEHRGQGLGRRVIEDALAHVDRQGHRTVVLWSEKVELYEKFGFAPLPESVFRARAPAAEPTAARRLDLDQRADLEFLQETLRDREPISRVAAAADDGWHFAIDLALWTTAANLRSADLLVALPEDGAVMVCEIDAGTLRLYDLLCRRPPSASRLVGAAQKMSAARIERLEICFSPDRLDLAAEPGAHPEEDVLMVRGAPLFERSGVAFAFSPLTRT